MIKRGPIIGIGTVLLVIGLTGLGLLQTGVIYPSASTGPVSLPEVKPPEQAAGSGQGSRGPVNQTAQPPAPAVGPPGRGPGQAPAKVGEQPPSAAPPSEKPVPVPQVGKGERRYPKHDQLAQPAPSVTPPKAAARKQKFDEKRFRALLKSESKRYTRKSEAKRYTRKSEAKRYARKAPPAHTVQPVVIRFNFDPAQSRRLDVAQVHLGDIIRVNVRRVGQVDRRVYFTFSKNINSPQGAVLKLETMYSFERPVIYRSDRGHYVIEIKIYPNNRWNITPRSFV